MASVLQKWKTHQLLCGRAVIEDVSRTGRVMAEEIPHAAAGGPHAGKCETATQNRVLRGTGIPRGKRTVGDACRTRCFPLRTKLPLAPHQATATVAPLCAQLLRIAEPCILVFVFQSVSPVGMELGEAHEALLQLHASYLSRNGIGGGDGRISASFNPCRTKILPLRPPRPRLLFRRRSVQRICAFRRSRGRHNS